MYKKNSNQMAKKNTHPCHLTGKHRAAVHQSCNLNVQKGQFSFGNTLFYSFNEYDS